MTRISAFTDTPIRSARRRSSRYAYARPSPFPGRRYSRERPTTDRRRSFLAAGRPDWIQQEAVSSAAQNVEHRGTADSFDFGFKFPVRADHGGDVKNDGEISWVFEAQADLSIARLSAEEIEEFGRAIDSIAAHKHFDADERGQRNSRVIESDDFFDGDLRGVVFFRKRHAANQN